MKLAFILQIEGMLSVFGGTPIAVAMQPTPAPPHHALQGAQVALQQLLATPECMSLAADRVRLARQLLEVAERAAGSDSDEVVTYFARLSERHAQEAAEVILRARCERPSGESRAFWPYATN
jgi:hypothetical protein